MAVSSADGKAFSSTMSGALERLGRVVLMATKAEDCDIWRGNWVDFSDVLLLSKLAFSGEGVSTRLGNRLKTCRPLILNLMEAPGRAEAHSFEVLSAGNQAFQDGCSVVHTHTLKGHLKVWDKMVSPLIIRRVWPNTPGKWSRK